MPAASLPALRGSRIAITLVFVVQALLFASWTAHIPQVKSRLALSDATLGIALLGAPLGSVAAMLVTGWVLPRLGSKLMVQITLAGYCLVGLTVGLAASLLELFAALALWGVFQGSLDVSMNAQGITVERALRRPIMSGLHGGWSIGSLLGAGAGIFGVWLGLPLVSQLLLLGVFTALSAGWVSRRLLNDSTNYRADHGAHPTRVLRNPTVLMLGGVVLASMLCEGAAADWSAVYLRDSLLATPPVAACGYFAFSIGMVTLRLSGNRLLTRRAPRRLLPLLAIMASLGFGAALMVGKPVVALVGFAALGVGLGCIVPTAFSAAGRLPGVNPGTAVAAVSALGWAGFVCGPPVIGHLAEQSSLPLALTLLPILTLVIAAAARSTDALDRATAKVVG